jgi:hypothetical protein
MATVQTSSETGCGRTVLCDFGTGVTLWLTRTEK